MVDKIETLFRDLSLSELEIVSGKIQTKIQNMRDDQSKKAFEELRKLESIYDSEILDLQDKLYNILKNRKTYIDLSKILEVSKIHRPDKPYISGDSIRIGVPYMVPI
jgi:hypothetical protein